MSAKDRLDTYERDWERHERWRMPHDDSKPGLYIDKGRDTCVKLHEMPPDLRTPAALAAAGSVSPMLLLFLASADREDSKSSTAGHLKNGRVRCRTD